MSKEAFNIINRQYSHLHVLIPAALFILSVGSGFLGKRGVQTDPKTSLESHLESGGRTKNCIWIFRSLELTSSLITKRRIGQEQFQNNSLNIPGE